MSDPTLSPDTPPPIDPSATTDINATTPTIDASSVPEGSTSQPSTGSGTLTAGGSSGGGGGGSDIVTTTPSMLATVVPSGWVLIGLATLLGAGWLFIHHSKVKSEYPEEAPRKRRKRARR